MVAWWMGFPALPDAWQATLLSAAVAFAVPILLAALGECLVERAGVINIGVEGLMLAATLAAVAGSNATHSPWVGLLCGAGAAAVLGAGFGWVTLYRGADQVVAGTALNLLAVGLTGASYFSLTQSLAARGLNRLEGAKLPDWRIPGLADLPLVGPLFNANVLSYLAFALIPATWFFLFRTRAGLQLRAVGEYPAAAEATGANVLLVRLAAVVTGAALAGLAGVFLSIGHVVTFAENMTAGKGFIALALVIFGRWNPWGVAGGTLVFSLAIGAATVMSTQGRGRPEEVVLLALPYLATLAALIFRPGRTTAPAALAKPYVRS